MLETVAIIAAVIIGLLIVRRVFRNIRTFIQIEKEIYLKSYKKFKDQ